MKELLKLDIICQSDAQMKKVPVFYDSQKVRNRFFYFVSALVPFFEENNSDLVWNEFGSVQKMRFDSDIIVIYYSCNSWVVNYSKYYSNSGWHDFDVTHNNNDK